MQCATSHLFTHVNCVRLLLGPQGRGRSQTGWHIVVRRRGLVGPRVWIYTDRSRVGSATFFSLHASGEIQQRASARLRWPYGWASEPGLIKALLSWWIWWQVVTLGCIRERRYGCQCASWWKLRNYTNSKKNELEPFKQRYVSKKISSRVTKQNLLKLVSWLALIDHQAKVGSI